MHVCMCFEGVPLKSEVDPGLESLLVDRAINEMMTLPDVVGEVALKNREQIEELRKQQQQLSAAIVGDIFLYLCSIPNLFLIAITN